MLLGTDEELRANLTKVVTLFAFFHYASIGEKLFSTTTEDDDVTSSPMSIFSDDGHWDHFKFEETVVKMQDLSLVQILWPNANEIVVSLHPMVSEWLRMQLKKGPESTFLATAVSHLKNYFNSTGHIEYIT